ncbi:hypothetical protein HanIR_Chr11g0545411 [Helianthus annuus]|nr:hypothetical protein HanIR_Chr11g0545411 [Helianthus annuus]
MRGSRAILNFPLQVESLKEEITEENKALIIASSDGCRKRMRDENEMEVVVKKERLLETVSLPLTTSSCVTDWGENWGNMMLSPLSQFMVIFVGSTFDFEHLFIYLFIYFLFGSTNIQ